MSKIRINMTIEFEGSKVAFENMLSESIDTMFNEGATDVDIIDEYVVETSDGWMPKKSNPIQGMTLTLMMDREIDEKKHFISPGGYSVKLENGEVIEFDFLDSEITISEDRKTIQFKFSNPDIECFPNMENLYPKMVQETIQEFEEIFVHTGEYGDLEINVSKICGIVLSDGNKDFILNPKSYSKINEQLLTKVKIKKYLTDEFLKTTDFNENQFGLLREFMTNESVLGTYQLEDLVEALTADGQELIGIYDVYYYNKYLKDDFNEGIPFEKIPIGIFNIETLQYKCLNGQYLIELQL